MFNIGMYLTIGIVTYAVMALATILIMKCCFGYSLKEINYGGKWYGLMIAIVAWPVVVALWLFGISIRLYALIKYRKEDDEDLV